MSDLQVLQKAFIEFIDGLWWGLRDNVGALSMYEGYMQGFRQMGEAAAENAGGKGAKAAAQIAHDLFRAVGLTTKLYGKEIRIEQCPIWERVLEKGLEYAFHIEEICWIPMLEGIGEKLNANPVLESSLRLIHVTRAKAEYKMGKAKRALESGKLSQENYENQVKRLKDSLKTIPDSGRYRFE